MLIPDTTASLGESIEGDTYSSGIEDPNGHGEGGDEEKEVKLGGDDIDGEGGGDKDDEDGEEDEDESDSDETEGEEGKDKGGNRKLRVGDRVRIKDGVDKDKVGVITGKKDNGEWDVKIDSNG